MRVQVPPPPFFDQRSLTVIDSYCLWVGIGCNRGTSQGVIAAAIAQVFVAYGLTEAAIAAIGTIDRKTSELGLVAFCRDRQLPLWGFSAAALGTVTVPNTSAIARAIVGTPSVAEAAALLAYQEGTQGLLASPRSLLVSKQIFRLSNQPGAVTLAVAGDSQ